MSQAKSTDGGAAFLTLRDYFAAVALQGLFSIEANPRVGVEMEPYTTKHNPIMAEQAYAIADAMLAARDQ
jgi:hypothetical protein